MLKNISTFNKERNKQLRERFDKYIKGNLLIRLKEEIKTSEEFQSIFQKCYDLRPKLILASGIDDVDYDICLKIAMNYWYHTLLENNDEKSLKNANSEFLNLIKTKVLIQCKLHHLNKDIGNESFYTYHTSLNYSIHSAINYMLSFLFSSKNQDLTIKNKNFKINTLFVILKLVRSILLLIESNNLGSAYSLFRTLLEIFCVYYVIYDDENVATTYYKFMNFRNEYDETGIFSEEFKKLVPSNVYYWENFLNYGWIDKLNNVGNHTKRKYVFKEVLKFMKIGDETYHTDYLNAYKFACKFSHGNYINQSFNVQHNIWILGRIAILIFDISNEFKKIFKIDFVVNNVDLIQFLHDNVIESSRIYSELSQKFS